MDEDTKLRNQCFIRGYWHDRPLAQRDHPESEGCSHSIGFAVVVTEVRLGEVVAANLFEAYFGHPSIF